MIFITVVGQLNISTPTDPVLFREKEIVYNYREYSHILVVVIVVLTVLPNM